MNKLAFNNPYMSLHVNSEDTLHRVVKLEQNPSNNEKGLICVADLFGRKAMAAQFPTNKLRSLEPETQKPTDFFVSLDNMYFAIQLVTSSQEEGNRYMNNHPDCALIATDNDGFHYIADLKPTGRAVWRG